MSFGIPALSFYLCILPILPLSCVALDLTHDPSAKSWIESANNSSHDFPIQNLPYGVFKKLQSKEEARIGIAIGDYILDLRGCIEEGLLNEIYPESFKALCKTELNAFMQLGRDHWIQIRKRVNELLQSNSPILRDNPILRGKLLIPIEQTQLLLPAIIGDYTDFYTSLYHAKNVGSMLRPDNPLLPNYKHMPIGYHGRSSSIVVSGTSIKWPSGQFKVEGEAPVFNLSQSLDYELEMGIFLGPGNSLGSRIDVDGAQNSIFGFVLVNDWSARDIQRWEYQPLGPFNSKNFSTSISPWVVTLDALLPFQIDCCPRSIDDPPLLDYLNSSNNQTLNINVEAYLSSEKMREEFLEPILICKGNLSDMYWTFSQMISQHTSTGCNLRSGDLIASGTISGPTKDSLGCLLERIALKMDPLILPDGTTRKFLKNGDEVILKAFAKKENYPRIGFGECRAIVSK